MKKGESLSMNVIIISAIALLVLAIIAFLLIKNFDRVDKGTACSGVGGVCADSCADGQLENVAYAGRSGGCSEGQICCVRTGNNVE